MMLLASPIRKLGITNTLLLALLAFDSPAAAFPSQRRNEARVLSPSFSTLLDDLKQRQFSGSLVVRQAGQVVLDEQLGVAFPGDKAIMPNSDTQYRIGSITKMFTGTMIVQLIEEGKLSFNSTLSEFFPEVSPLSANITITHMLRHQSGLLDYANEDENIAKFIFEIQTRQEMLQRIARYPAKFAPGTSTSYSNTNFLLLGYIVEDLAKASYQDELHRRITLPLNLSRTETLKTPNQDANIAYSFTGTAQNWEPVDKYADFSVPGGAGGIISTGRDLTSFLTALFASEQLVTNASLSRMMQQSPSTLGMAMGGFRMDDQLALGHNGAIDTFQSAAAMLREYDLAVVVLTNVPSRFLGDVAYALFRVAIGKEYELPSSINAADETDVEGVDAVVLLLFCLALLFFLCCTGCGLYICKIHGYWRYAWRLSSAPAGSPEIVAMVEAADGDDSLPRDDETLRDSNSNPSNEPGARRRKAPLESGFKVGRGP